MTETNYIKNYITNNRFRGLIFESDFETNYPNDMTSIASRIAADLRFDEQCRKNQK